MKEDIINAILIQNGKLTFKNLIKKFDIDSNELQRILHELKLDGKILQVSNKYMIFPNDLFIGNINISSCGNKFIFHNSERIPISSIFLNGIIGSIGPNISSLIHLELKSALSIIVGCNNLSSNKPPLITFS